MMNALLAFPKAKKKIFVTTALLALLLSISVHIALAKNITDDSVEILIKVGDYSVNKDEATDAIIIINNNTPFEVSVDINSPESKYLTINSLPSSTVVVPPYGSYQNSFSVIGKKTGTTEIILIFKYSWVDPSTNQIYVATKYLTSTPLTINGFRFDWPTYIIPLVLGFTFGQLGTWLADWRKRVGEDQIKQEQTIAITLAALQIGSKSLERHEAISFQLWDEMVLKGNLYPYLIRLGKKIKDEKLAHRLTVLTVLISEYNNSREKGDLSEDLAIDLSEEIHQLTKIIEQTN
jgi:hypothetical protein